MRNAVMSESSAGLAAPETQLTVRKASMHDIEPLLNLINAYAVKGVMLPRTEFEMSENIRDFTLAFSGDQLLGCGALHFYSPTSGEVRSLAVDPKSTKQGVGRVIVQALELEAIAFRLHSMFAFTYVTGFFERLGFHVVERGALPLKAWKDCLRCPKFQSCDEIAVIKHLVPDDLRASSPLAAADGEFIALPILQG